MGLRRAMILMALCLSPLPGAAEDGPVRLHVPAALAETGLLGHILPRFSLKTRVRVVLVDDPAQAQVLLGDNGRPVFDGPGGAWRMQLAPAPGPGAERLAGWLTSEVGLNTVLSFTPETGPGFAAPQVVAAPEAATILAGDARLGLDVSRRACARCHAVEEAGRKTDIGSTPSFFVLRAFADWEDRFAAFYALNPHPAFTQVAEITAPFPPDRPSPIAPVHMTINELEALMAYVSRLAPADLGAPLQAQDF